MERTPRHGATRAYPRTARVNALLRTVLGEAIERYADEEGHLGLVTITEVHCEADLRRAVVYCASLSAPTAEALEAIRIRLQHEIAEQVRLRRTPQLEFRADPAVAAGERVEAALRRVREGGSNSAPT